MLLANELFEEVIQGSVLPSPDQARWGSSASLTINPRDHPRRGLTRVTPILAPAPNSQHSVPLSHRGRGVRGEGYVRSSKPDGASAIPTSLDASTLIPSSISWATADSERKTSFAPVEAS